MQVGLHVASPDSLQRCCSFEAELPLLGASPDGIIVHTLPVTASMAEQLQCIAEECCRRPVPSGRGGPSRALGLLDRLLALVPLAAGVAGSAAGEKEWQCPASGTQSNDAASGDSHCGCASPQLAPSEQAADESGGSAVLGPDTINILQKTLSELPDGCALLHVGDCGAAELTLREAVEVKNVCPFAVKCTRSGHKGKVSSQFIVGDKGPWFHVHPQYLPQLQLHMLATGTASALLLSRSATKGVRMFRSIRDDVYINSMLGFISKFYCSHVVTGVRPPLNMWHHDSKYQQFLQATKSLARSAACVFHTDSADFVTGGHQLPFV